MVNDEWQYQPLNLGDGLPENLLEGMYAKTDKQQPWDVGHVYVSMRMSMFCAF
jgi:hypothetical protein